MSGLRLWFLGSPTIELDGRPITIRRSKVMALLVYLAVSGERQRRDVLAALPWPDGSQSRARASLRNGLAILNKTLGGGWLEIERETLVLSPAVWLDVRQLWTHLAAWDERDPHTVEALAHAVDLYRGDFLTGFTLRGCPEFDDWQFFQGESLAQAFVTALKKLTGMLTEQQSYEATIPFAMSAVAVDPIFETENFRVVRTVLQEIT